MLTLILHNILSFIVIISVIVFVHEFGHYWVARKCGVKIEVFSIGFGPELFGWNDRSGTRWKVALFPLGGYVKMFGDEGAASVPDAEKLKKLTPEQEKVAFHTQKLLAKAAIVSAGPLANFLLAIIILTGFFAYYGKPETTSRIGSVLTGSAAEEIGLRAGDIITEIGDKSVKRFEDIQDVVSISPGIELSIAYIRDEAETRAVITPKIQETKNFFGDPDKRGLIGVTPAEPVTVKSMPLHLAAVEGVKETYNISARTMTALGQMITGQRSADQLSGILRIGDYSGKAMNMGFKAVLWFMVVLSINLGLINLFPIPMLDGGHLMFYAIEAASGRPLAEKIQEYAFRAGFALLILLMLFATFNDLRHFKIL